MNDAVYILTLKLDAATFERVQAQRLAHFPPALNWIPAHLTLLHRMSWSQVQRLEAAWDRFRRRDPVPLRYARLQSLGRGVAIAVESVDLGEFRRDVMRAMGGEFSRQDLAPHRPHITLQNKVEPAAATALLQTLAACFAPWEGTGDGVLVWRYEAGPWAFERALEFAPQGGSASQGGTIREST